MKNSITEYTEREFIVFMEEIFKANEFESDLVLDPMLNHFRTIVEHPERTDLIYYSPDEECTPEAITEKIKLWLAENQKPGFKAP